MEKFMEISLVVSATAFFIALLSYTIYLKVKWLKPSKQESGLPKFQNPPPPPKPKTLEEQYFDLKIEAIRLMNEFRIVDAKMKEIEHQLNKNTNEKDTEKL